MSSIKTYAVWTIAAFMIVSSIMGLPVLAQEGLVPCGNAGGSFCDVCDVFVLLQTVLNKLWNPFAIVIAAAMLIYGGFLMLLPSFGSGSSAMHTRGVKVLTNTLIGLAIVFFAWVATDTVIKVVAGGMNNIFGKEPGRLFPSSQVQASFGPWNVIQCKRAPERAAVTLLGVPPELQCPTGATSKTVGAWDVCDPGIAAAYAADESIKGAPSGQCSQATINNLNKANGACGSQSCTSLINSIAAEVGVDPKTLRAIILIESSGNPNAQGPTTKYGSSCGIAQVLPSTAKLTCQQLKDAATGIRAGAEYLKKIQGMKETQGKPAYYAYIGYNGGERALEPSKDCLGQVKGECKINPGGYAQTIDYTAKVQGCLNML